MNGKYPDIGLLIIRVGLGALFLYHGFPLLIGGTEEWTQLGKIMEVFGTTSLPAFWGFVIVFSEVSGGIFLIFGILFKIACSLLLLTYMPAIATYIDEGNLLTEGSHVLQLAIILFGLMLIGSGNIRFSSK